MKQMIFLAIFGTIFSSAHADSYSCMAKANSQRGFATRFNISISPVAVGGKIVLSSHGKEKPIGTVSQMSTLNRANPADKNAFELTVGYIHEEDTSGVPAEKLAQVSSVQIFRAELPNEYEVLVYKLFAGAEQIGGSVMISGLGTSCLP